MRAGKSSSLTEKLGRVFSSRFGWHSARRGDPIRRRSSRCVSFAAHVKACACSGGFFRNGEICPTFSSSVLVGVDNLGTTVYSIAWLSFSLDNQLERMLRWLSGYRKGVSSLRFARKETGARSSEPGETCFPAYSADFVPRKTSILRGRRVLGR